MIYRIDNFWDGRDIKSYLRRSHGYSSRMLTKLRKYPNGILRNGVHARTIDILSAGDRLEINFPAEESGLPPSDIKVPVVYEDDWIAVFDKPPFMASHTTKAKQSDTLANVFAAHCAGLPFRPIGRLDRNTSGLMVIGKNKHAATVLQHAVKKEYYGFGCGKMPDSGVIEAPIGRPDENLTRRAVMEGGQYAKTGYTCYGNFGPYCFCSFVLYTGRTHQIRTHMQYMGAPLAGDELYGGSTQHIDRHALHCGRVTFAHPKTGKVMTLTSPMPKDMLVLLKLPYTK